MKNGKRIDKIAEAILDVGLDQIEGSELRYLKDMIDDCLIDEYDPDAEEIDLTPGMQPGDEAE